MLVFLLRGSFVTDFDTGFELMLVDNLRFRYVFMYMPVVLGLSWVLLSALGLLLVTLGWSWGDLGSSLRVLLLLLGCQSAENTCPLQPNRGQSEVR